MKTRAQKLGITHFPYHEYDKKGKTLYMEYKTGDWFLNKYNGWGLIIETQNNLRYDSSQTYTVYSHYNIHRQKIRRESWCWLDKYEYFEEKNSHIMKTWYMEYKPNKTWYKKTWDEWNNFIKFETSKNLVIRCKYQNEEKYDYVEPYEYKDSNGNWWSKQHMPDTPFPFAFYPEEEFDF